MKRWMAVVTASAFVTSSAMLAWGTEQESKSGSAESSHASEAKGKRVTGQLIHIEGWHYTVKDNAGQEQSFGVNDSTKLLSAVNEGDFVVAMIGDDNIATSVKNLKKSTAPPR